MAAPFGITCIGGKGPMTFTRAARGGAAALLDTMTDSDGVAIQSHTMDVGGPWSVLGGAGHIESNKLESVTSGTAMFIDALSGYSDCSVSLDVVLPASGEFTVGAAMRVASLSSGIVAAFNNDGGTTTLTIVAIGGGVLGGNAVLARFDCSPSAGSHNIEMTASGSTLTFKLDGVAIGDPITTTLNQTTKSHGIFSYFNGTYQLCAVDNFQVPNPSLPPAVPQNLASAAGSLTMTWAPCTGATSYDIQRRPTGAGSYVSVGTSSAPSFTDGTSPPIGIYDYKVRAQNGSGYSALSSSLTLSNPAGLLIYDDMVDANGTTLQAHTIPFNVPGTAWTKQSGGDVQIQSDVGVPQAANSFYWLDPGQTTCTVTLTMNISASDTGVYFNFRGSGETDFVQVYLYNFSTWVCLHWEKPGNDNRSDNNTFVGPGSQAWKIVLTPTHVKFYIGILLVFDYDSAVYATQTRVGFSFDGAVSRIQSLLVTTP